MPIVSFPMPFPPITATFYPPTYSTTPDAFGNPTATFPSSGKVETLACYAPSDTANEIEDGRPHADYVALTLYLPKDFATDVRGAKVTLATGDAIIDGMTFMVDGAPTSYHRDATPGDYSWVVRVVEYLG